MQILLKDNHYRNRDIVEIAYCLSLFINSTFIICVHYPIYIIKAMHHKRLENSNHRILKSMAAH
jgi:hypothetical protein